MNWTTMQGNWNEAKGKVKTKWGRLTDDDLTQVQGQKDRLVGVIQQKYGIAREKAEEQLEEFMSSGDSWLARAKEGAEEVVEKGKEYIHLGVEKGKEAVEKGKDLVHQSVDKGKEVIEKGKEIVHHGVEKGKETIEKGKEIVHHGVEKGKEAVEKGKDYVQNTTMAAMVGDLKSLIGRHPVQCAIIGVGLGFLIGRLLPSNRS